MCDSESTTTTSTETAPLSPLGREYQSTLQGLLAASLEEGGYDFTSEEVTEYEDKSKATSLQNQIKNTQDQIAAMDADIKANPPPKQVGAATATSGDPRVKERNKLVSQLSKQQNDLSGLPQATYTKHGIAKKPDPRLQAAIEKYGADSPEAVAMQDTIKQEGVQKASDLAEVTKTYWQNMKKYVSGDMSYTPEQKAQVEAYTGPVKSVIEKTADDLLTKYKDDDVKLKEESMKIGEQIDKTGFDTLSALQAAQVQIEKSGKDLFSVLEEANKSTENKFKFQQDLLFEQIDKSVSQQAAMLGLPPGSASENFQKAKMKQDVFTQLQLDLAEQTTKGKLGIQAEVEAGKKQISLSKVALAASQGEKKEKLAGENLAITGTTLAKEEQLLGTTGNALLQLEQAKQNMLQGQAYGNIPQLIGVGQSGMGFEKSSKAADVQLTGSLMGPVAGQLGVEQQRQTTEATTTQTQSKSPSFLDAFSQIANVGAGVAGAAISASNPLGSVIAKGTQAAIPGFGGGNLNLGNYGGQFRLGS